MNKIVAVLEIERAADFSDVVVTVVFPRNQNDASLALRSMYMLTKEDSDGQVPIHGLARIRLEPEFVYDLIGPLDQRAEQDRAAYDKRLAAYFSALFSVAGFAENIAAQWHVLNSMTMSLLSRHTEVQKVIAKGILSGQFGTDKAVLMGLIQRFDLFGVYIALEDISMAMYEGKLGKGRDVQAALCSYIASFDVTDRYKCVQINFALALIRGHLGGKSIQEEIATALLGREGAGAWHVVARWILSALFDEGITRSIELPAEQQRYIAENISGYLKDVTIVQRRFFDCLDMFTDLEARNNLVTAMCEEGFPIREFESSAAIGIVKGCIGVGDDRLRLALTILNLSEDWAWAELPRWILSLLPGVSTPGAVELTYSQQLQLLGLIRAGIFGKNAEVLDLLISRLTVFTDAYCQVPLVKVIVDGGFGEKGLAAAEFILSQDGERQWDAAARWLLGFVPGVCISEEAFVFDYESQWWIAEWVRNGDFQDNVPVLLGVFENLSLFTDANALEHIAKGFSTGKCGDDLRVRTVLAGQLRVFMDQGFSVECFVVDAMKQRRFGSDPRVLLSVIRQLWVLKNDYLQCELVEAIRAGCFGTNVMVLDALWQRVGVFASPRAQQNMANAVAMGYLGTGGRRVQVAQSFFDRRESEKWDEGARWILSCIPGVEIGRERLQLTKEQQIGIAELIRDGLFAANTELQGQMLRHMSVFTYESAECRIAEGVREGNFGCDRRVQKALADWVLSLGCELAQRTVGIAILRGRLGRERFMQQLVQRILLRSGDKKWDEGARWVLLLAVARYTEANAMQFGSCTQWFFTDALEHGKFGDEELVLLSFIRGMGVFSSEFSQRMIASVIQKGGFGDSESVLQALLSQMDLFKDAVAQRNIVSALCQGRLGEGEIRQQFIDFILGCSGENKWDEAVRWVLSCYPGVSFEEDPIELNEEQQAWASKAIFFQTLGSDEPLFETISHRLDVFKTANSRSWLR